MLIGLWLTGGWGFSLPSEVGQCACQVLESGPSQQDDHAALIGGLRQRRLFELARLYCDQQLQRTDLPAKTRGSLTVELLNTLTAEALVARGDQRVALLALIDQTAADFLTEPPPVGSFLVRAQQALAHVAMANLLRQELAAEMADATGRESALQVLRQARTLLDNLQRDIADAIPNRRNSAPDSGNLSVEELVSLNNNVRYQLAFCNLIRSQLYPETDRANRLDALSQVQQQLNEVSRAVSPGQTLWWKTRLAEVEGLRLMGNLEQARTILKDLPEDEIPVDEQANVLIQKIRLAMAAGDPAALPAFLQDPPTSGMPPSAMLAVERVAAAMQLATQANGEADRQRWLRFAELSTQAVERQHGSYWGRRAELTLIRAVGNQPATGSTTANTAMTAELSMLTRMASDAFRKQRYQDALNAYDQAIAKATQQNNVGARFQLMLQAGQTLEKLRLPDLAAERLIQAAFADTANPVAASAHLRGCWNLAQAIDAATGTTRSDLSARFSLQLQRHLETWSTSATADQARIWLGNQLQNQGDYLQANDQYLHVASTSPQLVVAIEQLIRSCDRYLTRIEQAGESTAEALASAITSWSQVRSTIPADSEPEQAFRRGQLHLDLLFGSGTPDPQLIERVAADPAAAPTAFPSTTALRIASLVSSQPTEAQRLTSELGNDLESLNLLDRYLQAALTRNALDAANAPTVRSINLVVADHALAEFSNRDQAGTAAAMRWLVRRSELLLDLDRAAEAVADLESLAQRFPQQAEIQMQLARAVSRTLGTGDPAPALLRWRRLAGQLKPHTANWYEAKYEVASLLVKTGDSEAALRLLRFLKANPPGWENSTYKRKFESLLQQLQQQP